MQWKRSRQTRVEAMVHFLQLEIMKAESRQRNFDCRQASPKGGILLRAHGNTKILKKTDDQKEKRRLDYLKNQAIPLYSLQVPVDGEFDEVVVAPLEMDWDNIDYLCVSQRRLMVFMYCSYGFGHRIMLRQLQPSTNHPTLNCYRSQMYRTFTDTIRAIEKYLRKNAQFKPLNGLEVRMLLGKIAYLRQHFDYYTTQYFLRCLKAAYLLETEPCSGQDVRKLYEVLCRTAKESVNLHITAMNSAEEVKEFQWNEELDLLFVQKYLQVKSMRSMGVFFKKRFTLQTCRKYFTRRQLVKRLAQIFKTHVSQANEVLSRVYRHPSALISGPQVKKIARQKVFINARLELCRIILGIETNVQGFYRAVEEVRVLKEPGERRLEIGQVVRMNEERQLQKLLWESEVL